MCFIFHNKVVLVVRVVDHLTRNLRVPVSNPTGSWSLYTLPLKFFVLRQFFFRQTSIKRQVGWNFRKVIIVKIELMMTTTNFKEKEKKTLFRENEFFYSRWRHFSKFGKKLKPDSIKRWWRWIQILYRSRPIDSAIELRRPTGWSHKAYLDVKCHDFP